MRDTAERFAEYVDLVARALGERRRAVDHAERAVVLGLARLRLGPSRARRPGHRQGRVAANHHLLLAHGLAVPILRSAIPDAKVGITLNLGVHRPGTDHEDDVAAAHRADGNLNRLFLDPVFHGSYPEDMLEHYAANLPGILGGARGRPGDHRQPLDFLGVNYYFPGTIMDAKRASEARVAGYGVPLGEQFPDLRVLSLETPGTDTTSMGWEVDASGLTELLVRVKREYTALPIYITENGAAFDDYVDPNGHVLDHDRISYLREHIVGRARRDRRGRQRPGLLRLEPARQLRMVLWLLAALRHRLGGLPDGHASAQGQLLLVREPRAQRTPSIRSLPRSASQRRSTASHRNGTHGPRFWRPRDIRGCAIHHST